MRFLLLLISLLILPGCRAKHADSHASSAQKRPNIKSYDDLQQFPQSVRSVVDLLKTMRPGCSIDEFQSALKQNEAVETPYGHFKDFEYYWSIETDSENSPFFIVAGAFFITDDGYKLTYSTVNIVEESGGKWRTVWCIEYNPDDVTPFHPPKIRGIPNGG